MADEAAPPLAPPQQAPLAAAQEAAAAAQAAWQRLLLERLHAAQMLLLDVPLASPLRAPQELARLRARAPHLQESAWQQVGAAGSPFIGDPQDSRKLLYDADDLLSALTATVGCHAADAGEDADGQGGAHAGPPVAQLPPARMSLLQAVRAPTLAWLQSFFADLRVQNRQVGADDLLHPWYQQQQRQLARRAAASGSVQACRAAARAGLPASERPWVWLTALGVCPAQHAPGEGSTAGEQPGAGPAAAGASSSSSSSSSSSNGGSDTALPPAECSGAAAGDDEWWRQPSDGDVLLLQQLCEDVQQQPLLTDALICGDVQQMASSPHYAMFADTMRAVLLAFSRDGSISHAAAVPPTPLLVVTAKDGRQLSPYPPSGVLPFQGLACYLAPLCCLFQHPAAVYRLFAALYCRHWCALHSLSAARAPAAGLPVLCRTFLELLQELDPQLYAHMGRLSASPLELVLPLITSAFACALAPSEVLLLWDRVIGFSSLLPLPVLAVAVAVFRRDVILAASSSDQVVGALEELGELRCIPLLQALLFDRPSEEELHDAGAQ